MCVLLKLHYAKFGASNLFFSKVIEEKPVQEELRNQCVGYVCKQFVFCKNVNENNSPLHIQLCYRVF